MRRDTRSAYRRRAADTERRVDEAVAEVKAEQASAWAVAKEKRAAELSARGTFTRDDVAGAGFVHDGISWRKVVKVNAKTVSVVSGYSWVDRVPFGKVIAVRGRAEVGE